MAVPDLAAGCVRELARGQVVEVRAAAEIAATLDAAGKLGGVPFMPEMLQYCGRRFTVYRRADRTCVEGLGMRGLHATVFLDGVRCDGHRHDGCQRNCLIFWKEAWLRPVSDGTPAPGAQAEAAAVPAFMAALPTRAGERYLCQSTELAAATTGHVPWNTTQILRELRLGELGCKRFLELVARSCINKLRTLVGLRQLGILSGKLARNSKGDLGLASGDWVEVKSLAEIEGTLDSRGKNCGLTFDPEMAIHAGRRFRVEQVIERIILEERGRMANLTRTVSLAGVSCQGICAQNCPRANPIYWREAWLKRVPGPA